jgi:hypothetical protein
MQQSFYRKEGLDFLYFNKAGGQLEKDLAQIPMGN